MKFPALWAHGAFLLPLCMVAPCGSQTAHTQKAITIRMLDCRTGHLVEASNFLVRVDRQTTVHGDWVHQNEDGTGTLTLPPDASLISIQATYETSTQVYVNCDSAEEKENPVDRWYKASEILASGVVAPNACLKPKDAAQLTTPVKAGEFIFYVRKRNWREKLKDYAE